MVTTKKSWQSMPIHNDDYILTEGQHKGIVSEEVWEKAHAKRLRTGVKPVSYTHLDVYKRQVCSRS